MKPISPDADERREIERVRYEHPSQGGCDDQHAHGDRSLGDDVVKGHPAFERLHRRLRGAGVLGVAGWRLVVGVLVVLRVLRV